MYNGIVMLFVACVMGTSVSIAQVPVLEISTIDETINELKLTEGGTWARDLVNDVRDKRAQVVTTEDAAQLVRSARATYRQEVFFPTKGGVDDVNGAKISRRSVDDHRLVIVSGKELIGVCKDLEKQFPAASIADDVKLLEEAIVMLEKQPPLAREERLKALDDMERVLEEDPSKLDR